MQQTTLLETITKFDEFRNQISEELQNREEKKIVFDSPQLSVKEKALMVGDKKISKESTNKILSLFRVKNNFLEFSEEMAPSDWENVSQRLKNISSRYPIIGYVDSGVIEDVMVASPKGTMGGIDPQIVFEAVRNSILNTTRNYEISRTSYDKGKINIDFLESDQHIDIFGTGDDIWKVGKSVSWSLLDFKVTDYLHRLVCTNGASMTQYGFISDVSKNKFRMGNIEKALHFSFVENNPKEVVPVSQMVIDACNHLKKHNASVQEFLQFRSLFELPENDENYKENKIIADKWFNQSYLDKAYRTSVDSMPAKWKSTADTGKNAYDMFNDLTYIISHPEETKVKELDRRDMQIKASNFLFKENLDMEMIAPKVTFSLT